jgi:pimeloyl-ACP methyl ester carboxylesterase
MNKAIRYGGYALGGVAAIWLALAANSGAFMSRAGRYAVEPGAFVADGFAKNKKIANLPSAKIAYLDVGQGPPLILLHGCPFSGYEYKDIIPRLSKTHRVIVPDLIGLGDTPVKLDQDYRLPHDVTMVIELMDQLGIKSASFVAHDHGGATALLMMNKAPERMERIVLTNIEAYDRWPSKPELPYLKGIVNPVTSPLLYHAFGMDWLKKKAFGVAFYQPDKVPMADYRAFTMQHTSSPERWQRLRRFFGWQLDPAHNKITMTALPGMRTYSKPVLLLWGERDENFGPDIARRLMRDIPGVTGIRWMWNSAHMPMMEEPEAYAGEVENFLAGGIAESRFESVAALRP